MSSEFSELIDQAQAYFKLYPPSQGSKVLAVDFAKVAELSPELAYMLLDNPEDGSKVLELGFSRDSDMCVNPLTTLSNTLNKVNKENIINMTYEYPKFCIDKKTTVLYILSVAEMVTHKDLESALDMTTQAVSMLLSRLKDAISEASVNLTLTSQQVNSKTYVLTEIGKKQLDSIIADYNSRFKTADPTIKAASDYEVRIYNLPKSAYKDIPAIRSKDLRKLLFVEGVVRQKGDIRPQVTSARFECPSCGNTLTVLQLDTKFKEPSKCGCGRKGKFRLHNKEMIDMYSMILESIDTAVTVRIPVFVSKGLVDMPVYIGQRVRVSGVLNEVPITTRDGSKSVKFDWLIYAKNLEVLEDESIMITAQDACDIKAYASSHPLPLASLREQLAPDIRGNSHLKDALLLQAVSLDSPAIPSRLRIHMHIVGLPGSGKTKLALHSAKNYNKHMYADCSKASSVGLTASVVKDEILKGWTLEAGALVLAGDGRATLDEIDKMNPELSQSIGEPMEKGTITVSKANIHQSIYAPCRVLALGNYREGSDITRLDSKSLNLMPQIIDRFDLIFRSEKVDSRSLAKHILSFLKPQNNDNAFLRKYLFYASKHELDYELPQDCQDKLTDFFCLVQSACSDEWHFSARLLESARRLAYASAKLRLAPHVEIYDIEVSLRLVSKSLKDRGVAWEIEERLPEVLNVS